MNKPINHSETSTFRVRVLPAFTGFALLALVAGISTVNADENSALEGAANNPASTSDPLTGGSSATNEQPPVVQTPPKAEDGIPISKTNLRASDFIGAKVKNTRGDTLGEITDLMINWPESKMNYAILSYGGVAGIGAKLYAIPITELKAASQGNVLVLDLPESALENSEGFTEDSPPELANVELFEATGEETSEFSSMEEEKSLLEKAAEKLSGKSSAK